MNYRKHAFVSWQTGIYACLLSIYAYFPGKYVHNFGFKMHKVQKCGEKPLKKQKSLEWAFICSFSRIQEWRYNHESIGLSRKNIRAVLLCQCFCLGKKSIICTKGNWNHVRGLEVLGSLVYFVFKLLLMVGCFCSANSSVMLHMTWICLEPNHQLSSSNNYNLHIPPRCSMYGICMYIYLHLRMSFGVNVDTYSIHGAYGPWYP